MVLNQYLNHWYMNLLTTLGQPLDFLQPWKSFLGESFQILLIQSLEQDPFQLLMDIFFSRKIPFGAWSKEGLFNQLPLCVRISTRSLGTITSFTQTRKRLIIEYL